MEFHLVLGSTGAVTPVTATAGAKTTLEKTFATAALAFTRWTDIAMCGAEATKSGLTSVETPGTRRD
jgi:hypothetical protein